MGGWVGGWVGGLEAYLLHFLVELLLVNEEDSFRLGDEGMGNHDWVEFYVSSSYVVQPGLWYGVGR